jgi:hypothetical protein
MTKYEELAEKDAAWLKEYTRRYDQTEGFAKRLTLRFLRFLEVPNNVWAYLTRRENGEFESACSDPRLNIYPEKDDWYSFGVSIDFYPAGVRHYFSTSLFIFRARLREASVFQVRIGERPVVEVAATDDAILTFCESIYQGLKQYHGEPKGRIGFQMPPRENAT